MYRVSRRWRGMCRKKKIGLCLDLKDLAEAISEIGADDYKGMNDRENIIRSEITQGANLVTLLQSMCAN